MENEKKEGVKLTCLRTTLYVPSAQINPLPYRTLLGEAAGLGRAYNSCTQGAT